MRRHAIGMYNVTCSTSYVQHMREASSCDGCLRPHHFIYRSVIVASRLLSRLSGTSRGAECTVYIFVSCQDFSGCDGRSGLEMCRPKCIFVTTVSFLLSSVVVVCVQSFDETMIFSFSWGLETWNKRAGNKEGKSEIYDECRFLTVQSFKLLKVYITGLVWHSMTWSKNNAFWHLSEQGVSHVLSGSRTTLLQVELTTASQWWT